MDEHVRRERVVGLERERARQRVVRRDRVRPRVRLHANAPASVPVSVSAFASVSLVSLVVRLLAPVSPRGEVHPRLAQEREEIGVVTVLVRVRRHLRLEHAKVPRVRLQLRVLVVQAIVRILDVRPERVVEDVCAEKRGGGARQRDNLRVGAFGSFPREDARGGDGGRATRRAPRRGRAPIVHVRDERVCDAPYTRRAIAPRASGAEKRASRLGGVEAVPEHETAAEMRGGGRTERRGGEARAERTGKRADVVEVGADAVGEDRAWDVEVVLVVVVAVGGGGASRARGGDGRARGRRGEALDDREGGADVEVATAGVAGVVAGGDEGEPCGGGEDQREGQRQGAMEIRGGGGGGGLRAGRARGAARGVGGGGVAVVKRVVVVVGRVVGRVPAATTTRGQRRRRRRGERGENGRERHGVERVMMRIRNRPRRVDGRTRARGVHELAHVHRTSATPATERDAPEGLNPTNAQSVTAREASSSLLCGSDDADDARYHHRHARRRAASKQRYCSDALCDDDIIFKHASPSVRRRRRAS